MEHKKSENIKLFLDNKLKDCEIKIKKMKRKRKVIKILYTTTVVASIIISTTVASIISMVLVPAIVITTLSAASAILTGISARFNFQNKKEELTSMISRLERLKQQMNYVITCNGDLTEKESNDIIKEFL
jgi:hypothetical protein